MFEISTRKLTRRPHPFRALTKADNKNIDRSIKEEGIINALHCHLINGKIMLYDGRRRLASARRLGIKKVPVILQSKLVEQLYLNPGPVIWAAIEVYSINQINEMLGKTNTEIKRLLWQNKPTVAKGAGRTR